MRSSATRTLFKLFAIAAVVVVQTAAPRAHAMTFTAAFSPIRVHARAGEVITTNYSLKLGKGSRPVHFHAKVEDWWRSEDGSRTFYRKPGTLKRSCGRWVSLDPVRQAVKPLRRLNMRVTIAVPKTVKPGGYWCALTVNELPNPLDVAKNSGMAFVASFSTGIYIFVSPVKRAAKIIDVRVSKHQVRLTVKNTGNTPMRVSGRFEFLRAGDSVPFRTVAIERGLLLPEPVRKSVLTGKLPSAKRLPSGKYLVRALVDIGLPHYIGVQKVIQIRRSKPAKSK